LTHLQQLEAESIHIIREAVARSDNPVMLDSIGRDPSVLLRLALKEFYPGKPPFPLLHIDTTWKFREMIAFRDHRETLKRFQILEIRSCYPANNGMAVRCKIGRWRATAAPRRSAREPLAAKRFRKFAGSA
jgi:3'-phosphoadenosine 5'-phosphosulfate sulfotransferase (PAPS reductase)/FAD synthetase